MLSLPETNFINFPGNRLCSKKMWSRHAVTGYYFPHQVKKGKKLLIFFSNQMRFINNKMNKLDKESMISTHKKKLEKTL